MTVDGDGINEEIAHSVDAAGNDIEKHGDEHGDRYGEHFSEGFFDRMKSRVREKFGKTVEPEFEHSGRNSGRSFAKHFGDGLDDDTLSRIADRVGSSVGGHLVDSLIFAMRREGGDGENPIADLVDRWMEDTVSGNGRGRRGRQGGLGALIGRLFGAGSRNNFLNVLGKSIGGVISLIELGAKAVGKFAANMKEAEKGASLLSKIGTGLTGSSGGGASALSSLGSAAAGAAPAVAAVTLGLTVMASVAGALIGILTALAATILSGLVGALAVAGPAILAVVAAGGLLTAAFMSMTDAQQALLKGAFLPIKKEMVGIAQLILRDLVPAFAVWSKNIQQALTLLVPVATVMGKAFAQAGNIFTQALTGPGFRQFAIALTRFLPTIITSLSSALGGFLNGMLSIFAVLLPLVNLFSTYLAGVAARFAAWAGSAQGRNSIEDFANRAVASLKALWDFVGSFMAAISAILFSPQAQSAGNSIFTSLARTFDSLTRKIKQAAANGDLKKWFDDAIKFGGQLWSVVEALIKTFIKLYNSGVLSAVGKVLATIANVIDALNTVLGPLIDAVGFALPTVMKAVLAPLQATAKAIIAVGNAVKWVLDIFGLAGKVSTGTLPSGPGKGIGSLLSNPLTGKNPSASSFTPAPKFPTFDTKGLISSGTSALNATSIGSGGFRQPKEWKNPYIKFAQRLIQQAPSIRQQIRAAMQTVNQAVIQGIKDASSSTDASAVVDTLQSTIDSIAETASNAIQMAQDQLQSAAQDLLNASSPKEARKALKEVHKAQKNIRIAQAQQKRIFAAEKILAAQGVVSPKNVEKLLDGVKVANATLADYATARARVADLLSDANQKLADAISLRDNYVQQVSDSVKQYGSLVTAQAQVIDGVTQALTTNDIVTNLQDRLSKIQTFQSNLRLLLAQGLSQDAYKQIVDAGVEAGSDFAQALVDGGAGTVSQVNELVSQIGSVADQLGTASGSYMYQAGVDAAQGLVDGLTSLSAQLEAAAAHLGDVIANQIAKTLGIASPAKRLIDMMGYVGDGAVVGLDAQHVKVGAAAARLADQIAVSPAAARYGSGTPSVSGNLAGADIDLTVITPTEDPKAVANEAINELVGRL
jgi:hypothetical protein